MLYEFLSSNRNELISRCLLKVAQRTHEQVSEEELGYGIPMFLDQLIKTLRVEQTTEPMESRKVSGPPAGRILIGQRSANQPQCTGVIC